MDKVYRKEMAKWLGIAPNSLIYLEKKGFIPVSREDNEYRFYRADSVARLLLYRYFRSYGYDINEAIDVFYAESNDKVLELLQQRERMLEEEKLTIEKRLYALRKNKANFSKISENAKVMEIIEMPEAYVLRNKESSAFADWINAMPIVKPCFEITMEKKDWLDLDYCYVVFQEDLKATETFLDTSDASLFHHKKKVMHGWYPLLPRDDQQCQVKEYLREQGIVPTGTILCGMAEEICFESNIHVLELWIPIE